MSKGPFPSETQDRFIVRFPDGMRDYLKDAADLNRRSMNAEIVKRLQQTMGDAPKREPVQGFQDVTVRLDAYTYDRVDKSGAENERSVETEILHILKERFPWLDPINDLIDRMNLILAAARKKDDDQTLRRLEDALYDLSCFYEFEATNPDFRSGDGSEVKPLNVADPTRRKVPQQTRD